VTFLTGGDFYDCCCGYRGLGTFMGWIVLGLSVCGLRWSGSKKMDPSRPTMESSWRLFSFFVLCNDLWCLKLKLHLLEQVELKGSSQAGLRYSWRKMEAAAQDRVGWRQVVLWLMLMHWVWQGLSQVSEFTSQLRSYRWESSQLQWCIQWWSAGQCPADDDMYTDHCHGLSLTVASVCLTFQHCVAATAGTSTNRHFHT